MKSVEFVAFGKIKEKDVIIFQENGTLKATDGFHDRKVTDETRKYMTYSGPDVKPIRVINRLRGSRPWHPLLKMLLEQN